MEFDPAADFLSREQAELGDITQELGFESEPTFGSHEMPVSGDEPPMSDFMAGGFTEQSPEQAMFEQPSYPVFKSQPPLVEPEKIKQWRVEYRERIEKKDADEQSTNNQLRQQAQKEMEDWVKHNVDQRVKRVEMNRENQKAFIAQRDETLPGAEWERVCRLCTFGSSKSAHKDSNKDSSRLKGLLLSLKQSPPQRKIL